MAENWVAKRRRAPAWTSRSLYLRTGRQASIWLMAAAGSVALSQFLIVAVVSRVLGVSVAGEYGLAQACVTPLVLMLGLSLREVFQAEYQRASDFGGILALRLVASGGLVVVASCVALIPGVPVLPVILLALARAADLVGDLYAGVFLHVGRPASAALPIIVNQALSMAVFALAVVRWHSLAAGLAASATVSILVSAVVPWVMSIGVLGLAHVVPRFGLSRLARWARPAVILGLAAAVTALAAMVPKYALQAWSTPTNVGLFTVAFAVASLPSVAFGAIAQGNLSILVKARREFGNASAHAHFRRVLRQLILIGAATSVVLFAAADPILEVIFGPEFGAAAPSLRLLSITNLAFSIIWALDVRLVSMSHFKTQVRCNVTGMIATMASAIGAVPWMGLIGAGLALTVGAGTSLAVKALSIRGIQRVD